MHASVNELLSLRDDVVVDDAVATHVQGCDECRAELDRLHAVRAGLRALPMAMQSPDRWGRIETALALSVLNTPLVPLNQASTKRPGWAIPLAAAAVVLATVAALTWHSKLEMDPSLIAQRAPIEFQEPQKQAPEEQVVAAPTQEELAAQSRQLEQVLAALPPEPSVTRASTAFTLAELQDRIRWVDYRLSLGEEARLEPQQSEMLWQEKVDLLNSLVAVRYAQVRTAF